MQNLAAIATDPEIETDGVRTQYESTEVFVWVRPAGCPAYVKEVSMLANEMRAATGQSELSDEESVELTQKAVALSCAARVEGLRDDSGELVTWTRELAAELWPEPRYARFFTWLYMRSLALQTNLTRADGEQAKN